MEAPLSALTYFIVIFQNFSTYITSPGKLSHDEAIDYCLSQHSAGLVTWDSDDKYQEVKYIVGRNGKDEEALTALHNPNKEECSPSAPCGANRKLVRHNQLLGLFRIIIFILASLQAWNPNGTVRGVFSSSEFDG